MSNRSRPILLIGKSGQVGRELQRALAPLGDLVVADRGDADYPVDLAEADSIRNLLDRVQPSLLINAAAYTAVDKAEEEEEEALAMAINGTAAGILAEEAKRLAIGLVHYSTDYVFDGTASEPYTEQSAANPLGVYGRSKLAGDQAIEAVGGASLVLRTSWVYGLFGGNFMLTMLRLAQQRDELSVVDDQIGSPTWSRMIAETTAQIIARARIGSNRDGGAGYLREHGGLYNLTSSGETSWYRFACAILQEAVGQKMASLKPIPTCDYPTPAARPLYSVLSGDKLAATFGLQVPDWRQALALCMEDLQR